MSVNSTSRVDLPEWDVQRIETLRHDPRHRRLGVPLDDVLGLAHASEQELQRLDDVAADVVEIEHVHRPIGKQPVVVSSSVRRQMMSVWRSSCSTRP